LWRIDEFDNSTRKVLTIAATIGSTFNFDILVGVIKTLNVDDSVMGPSTIIPLLVRAIASMVQAGVIYIEFNHQENTEQKTMKEWVLHLQSSEQSSNHFHDLEGSTIFFSHDIWRESILELMLDQQKKKIHQAIAKTLESNWTTEIDDDYRAQLKLFHHWKSGGDFVKAATAALKAGRIFGGLNLHSQNIHLYETALTMWTTPQYRMSDCLVVSPSLIQDATSEEFKIYIHVSVSLGQALTNLHRFVEATNVFQSALRVSLSFLHF
jgi:hypothetical protein